MGSLLSRLRLKLRLSHLLNENDAVHSNDVFHLVSYELTLDLMLTVSAYAAVKNKKAARYCITKPRTICFLKVLQRLRKCLALFNLL
jgi:hypothetical protein